MFGNFSEKSLWWSLFRNYSVQTATLLSTDFTADCFRNMFWKLVVLKKFFWEKYLYCVNIRITLLPCSAQPTILPKLQLLLALSEKALEILMNLQENFLGESFFLIKLQVLSLSTSLPVFRLQLHWKWHVRKNSYKTNF